MTSAEWSKAWATLQMRLSDKSRGVELVAVFSKNSVVEVQLPGGHYEFVSFTK